MYCCAAGPRASDRSSPQARCINGRRVSGADADSLSRLCRPHPYCRMHGPCCGVRYGAGAIPFHELDEPPGEFALISDLVVLEPFRRRGFGGALLAAAERYARELGASELRIGVLSGNHTARRLYCVVGFDGYLEVLTKRFDRDESADASDVAPWARMHRCASVPQGSETARPDSGTTMSRPACGSM